MPIYEYQCQDCLTVFEKLTFKEEDISCPNCGSKNLKKLVSTFASLGRENGGACSSCSAKSCSSCK